MDFIVRFDTTVVFGRVGIEPAGLEAGAVGAGDVRFNIVTDMQDVGRGRIQQVAGVQEDRGIG